VRRSDLISGALLVLFGLVMIFIIIPDQIDSTGEYGLDPKFFPVSLLWLVVIMAIALVGSRLALPAGALDDEAPIDGKNWLFIVGASLYLTAGFIAVTVVGFIPATILMIAVLMYLMGVRDEWLKLAAVSVVAPLFIYFAMRHVFTIQLP